MSRMAKLLTVTMIKIDHLIENVLILLTALIVVVVSWQVFSRYLLQMPSSTSAEISRFLLIWITMIGSAYCYRTKAHLGLNILTNKLPAKQQQATVYFSHVVVLIFSVLVLLVGGGKLVYLSYYPIQHSPALHLPMGVVYLALPLSGILLSCYALIECFTLQKVEHKNTLKNHGLAKETEISQQPLSKITTASDNKSPIDKGVN